MPTITRGRLTSPYGYQAWRGYVHSGCDLAGITPGTKPDILAAADGVVELVGTNRVPLRRGTHIVIRHDDGIRTFYGHVSGVRVRQGQRVTRRQPIATMDHTGLSASAGIHLHFEVWRTASHTSHTNPIGWLRLNGWRITNGRLEDRGDPNTTTTAASTPTPAKKEWLDMVSENDLRRIIREETATARWSYKGNQDRDAWAFLINGANAAVDAKNQAIRNKNALEPITVNRSGNKSSHPLKTIISGLDTVARQNRARLAAIEEAIAQLSKAEGVELDYTKIEAAAQRGAENALAEGIEVEITATATPKKEG